MSWVRQGIMTGIGGVSAGLFCYFCFRGDWWIVGGVLGAFLTGIPLDKIYDGRFRKLEKRETKSAA
jgi:hypothetical protein